MRLLPCVVIAALVAPVPASAQVSASEQRTDTFTVAAVSRSGAASAAGLYIEHASGQVAVSASELSTQGQRRGVMHARGEVELRVEPGTVSVTLRAAAPGEVLRLERQMRDSVGTVLLIAEGPSIALQRDSTASGLRVSADRMQTRRLP